MSQQPFWKLYGLLNILSRYLRLPSKIIKKVCNWDHGWTPLDKPLTNEDSSLTNIILVWNQRRKLIIENNTNKKALITGVPFIHWRKRNSLLKSKDATGNVFFAAHGSKYMEIKYNVIELQQHILCLPEVYRPSVICLYWLDIERGYKELYEELGYRVITAGDPYDEKFVERLYSILCKFKYCSSNSFGTYALYALDLGIPFFIFGDKPKLVNKGDDNFETGRGEGYVEIKKKIASLFVYKEDREIEITPDQHEFFLRETGARELTPVYKIRMLVFYYWIKRKFGF